MNLYPFQQEAVEKTVRFLRERGCCYNASEPGLGKTVVSLTSIERLTKTSDTLIVCPAVVKLVWEAEAEKWGFNCKNLEVFSYDTAKKERYYKAILEKKWDYLILDECHYLSGTETQRKRGVLDYLWDPIPNRICLSGTVFNSSIMDCWTVFRRMAPEAFPDYWDFAKEYVNIERGMYKTKFVGVRNHEKLKKIIHEKFFFRYLKANVLPDLPEKTYQQIPLGKEYLVSRTPDEEKAYERYLELLKQSFAQNTHPPVPPKALATTIREQGLKKVPAIAEFARNLLDSGVPIAIFFWHKDVGNKIKEELKQYEPVSIEGSTSEIDRKRSVDSFQAGETSLFIGQIKASGVGITLTRGSTALLAELSFSPSDIQQTIDRFHRIGQKNPVTVYWFPVIGSTDEKLQEALMQKSTTFKKVLG